MYSVWGIGNVSNNIVESYSLWMGLSLAKEMGIQNLLALGDSMLIICAMENKKGVGNNALNSLFLRIRCLASSFEGISFFHISGNSIVWWIIRRNCFSSKCGNPS